MCTTCAKMACSECLLKWDHVLCPHCRQTLNTVKVPWIDEIQTQMKGLCHHNAPFNYYCNSCKVCCCAECVLQSHLDHKLEKIDTQYEMEKTKLEAQKSKLLDLESIYSSFLDQNQKVESAISQITELLKESPATLLEESQGILDSIDDSIPDIRHAQIIPKEEFNFNFSINDGELLYTPIFKTDIGLEWRLKIYPRGNPSAEGKAISVFLELAADPFNSVRSIAYKITMNATSREFTSQFKAGESWGYNKFIKLSDCGRSSKIQANVSFSYSNILEYCRDATYKLSNRLPNVPIVSTRVEIHVDNKSSESSQISIGLVYPEYDEEEEVEELYYESEDGAYPVFDLARLQLDALSVDSSCEL